jgi:hypothetical protein
MYQVFVMYRKLSGNGYRDKEFPKAYCYAEQQL